MAARKSQVSKLSWTHNHWKRLILGLALLLFAAAPVQADDAEAKQVVQRYFEALNAGDVETIQSLLGERLLARKERLLSNPTYGDYLRDHYQNISVTIATTAVGPDAVEVKVELEDTQDDAVQALWLKLVPDSESGSYRITEEREDTPGS